MNSRLRQIIDYSTNGSQAEFAALMGWTPQYLNRLIKGEVGMGVRPIVAILEKFPDINARWLLLGEGAMLNSGIDAAKEHLLRLLTLEKYMPVMSADELRQLTVDGRTDFPEEDIARWQHLLNEREQFIKTAIQRSSKCKTTTAK